MERLSIDMELTEDINTLQNLNSLLEEIQEKRDEIKATLNNRLKAFIDKGPENLDDFEYFEFSELIVYSDLL